MVSLKKNISLFFINSLAFICFMGLFSIANAVSCTGSQRPCCKGKEMSCCAHPGYGSNGMELSYDLSGCQNIDPIRPPLGPIDPIDPDDLIIDPIVKECTSGQVQYKPSGSCGTSERTCCSNGKWSDWETPCPTTKTCPTSSEPKTKESCYGGYKYRLVTCNESTGTWTTGSWGPCDCSNLGFETVFLPDGSPCCQRKDGTGLRCKMVQETVGHRWESFGISYNCSGSCPVGTPVAGAACPDSWAGGYCTTHHSWSNRGEEICNQFYCR